jgi:hypothetical protein
MGIVSEFDLVHNFAVVNVHALMFKLDLSEVHQKLCPMVRF